MLLKVINTRLFKKALSFFVLILIIELFSYLYLKLENENENGVTTNKIRAQLLGVNIGKRGLPYFLCQPNITLSNYPNKSNGKEELVNDHGYRGKLVNVKRNSKKRILFLGESTTFGYGVSNCKNYISILEDSLNKKFDVEFINGGILGATSSEVLSNYIFKYKYYNPDIVVVKTGLNELDMFLYKNYQPDYTNFRNINFNIYELPTNAKFLLSSNFVSILYIKLFIFPYFDNGFILSNETNKFNKKINWFDRDINVLDEANKNNYFFLAFYNNLQLLIEAIGQKKIIIVTNNYNKNFSNESNENFIFYKRLIAEYNKIIKKFAIVYESVLIDIPNEAIDDNLYFDDCHFNEEGHRIYANYYYPILEDAVLKIKN
jgi:lysophospholipase L1-like esterase